jgi:hypothetical protein
MQKQPLHLRLLFHPQSELAHRVAQSLLERFVEPPATIGLRIPTFFGPDNGDRLPPPMTGAQSVDLDVAEHTIVVLLSDITMVRQVEPNDTGDEWRACAKTFTDRVDASNGRHEFFAAALDSAGFGISEDRNIVKANAGNFEEVIALISMHIAKTGIILLRDQRLNVHDSRELKAPVTFFLSHAKADYKTTYPENELEISERPETRWIIDELAEAPISYWFDSAKIKPNEHFATRIEQGVRDSATVIAVLTDQYASRPWCRREILAAKRFGCSIVVVDALQRGEPRSFPYLGNVPTIRWHKATPELGNRIQARNVIDLALRESLRVAYNRAASIASADTNECPLATTPELISLANDPCQDYLRTEKNALVFVYPDPPLSSEELEVLQRIYPHVSFLTPLAKFAREPLGKSVRHVAVSISDVPEGDLRKHGLSPRHFNMMKDELYLYLLLAGAQIGYGGALQGDMTKQDNFTMQLLELVRCYSPLAEDSLRTELSPVVNYAPWPLSAIYTDAEKNLLQGAADLISGAQPAIVDSLDKTFPDRTDKNWRLLPDTAAKRFAWGLGLTEMRRQMVEECSSRVITGGRLTGSQSAVPGVLEEAWLSIVNRKPLFLVGALGGMAAAVAGIIEGREVEEFTDAACEKSVPNYLEVVELHGANGIPFISASEMMQQIREASQNGVANSLNNGLNDEENQELFRLIDPASVAKLIITGLRRLDIAN